MENSGSHQGVSGSTVSALTGTFPMPAHAHATEAS